MAAGYSSTTLIKNLGIKEEAKLLILMHPMVLIVIGK
jgi:hypothetical protein